MCTNRSRAYPKKQRLGKDLRDFSVRFWRYNFFIVFLNEKQNLLKTYKSNLKIRTKARLFCFFVFDIRKCFGFYFTCSFHMLKKLYLLHCISLLPFHRLINHLSLGIFLGSLVCLTDICICFCARTTEFWLL